MLTTIAAAAASLVIFTSTSATDGQRMLTVTRVKLPTLQACETLRDSLRGGAGIEHAQCEARESKPRAKKPSSGERA